MAHIFEIMTDFEGKSIKTVTSIVARQYRLITSKYKFLYRGWLEGNVEGRYRKMWRSLKMRE